MSVFRSVLIVCLISSAAALGLFFLGSLMGYEEFRGGYAVITLDESVDDRMLRAVLDEEENQFGGIPESESSQWVFLDEFDSVKMIPLDKFHSRIFPFDPRYDGYADLLRNIFVRDGKRYVYIPLKTGNWNIKLLDSHFNELLKDFSFSIDYYGVGRPLYFFFISYAAASFCLLVICLVIKRFRRQTALIIVLIPVLSSLSFFGAPGIACAGLCIAFFVMFREMLGDLVSPERAINRKKASGLKYFLNNIVLPYGFNWIALPFFAAAFYVITAFSRLEPLFTLVVFAVSAAVFISSIKILSLSRREHRRFTPVLIVRRNIRDFAFSFHMLPFAAAAFIVFFFAHNMSAAYDTKKQFDAFVSEQDYHAHINYQVLFSTRQLSTSSYAFPGFFIDSDGLPSMVTASAERTADFSDYPPFPLENLMEFFYNVNSGLRTNTDSDQGGFTEVLPLLSLLLFIIPGFIIKRDDGNFSKINLQGKNENAPLHGKLRLAGINWNKNLLYNERRQLRIQKDA